MSECVVEEVPGVEDTTRARILDRAVRARQVELDAAAALLVAAVDWAHAHPCVAGETPAGWGASDLHGEGVVPLAGVGAPLVAEFAPATFGAHVGLSTDAARDLLGDALELCHRLPRLWQLVRSAHLVSDRLAGADRLPAWRARQAAQATRSLEPVVVDEVDRWLSQTAVINASKVTSVEIAKTVAACRAHVDPEHAEAKAKADADHRHVTLTARHRSPADAGGPLSAGVTEVTMLLDTPDAQMFDNTIAHLATTLGRLGDGDSWDIRRARSVGVLADPQRAIDLLCGTGTDPRPRTTRSAGSGEVTLHLHLDPTSPGVVDAEQHGPLTPHVVRDWLERLHLGMAGTRLVVRPVLDLTDPATLVRAVDQHDPPEWMREAALLRDATCVFPSCTRDSRRCDLDHRLAYVPPDPDHPDDGGPPGQTSLANLGPLCRHHHRLKTHHAWTWQREADNTYTWTTPDGHTLHSRTQRRRH